MNIANDFFQDRVLFALCLSGVMVKLAGLSISYLLIQDDYLFKLV